MGVLRGYVGAAPAKSPLIPERRALRRRAVVVGLVAAVLAVFCPALNNGFVDYDDIHYLTENLYVRRGFTAETLPLMLLSHNVAVVLRDYRNEDVLRLVEIDEAAPVW